MNIIEVKIDSLRGMMLDKNGQRRGRKQGFKFPAKNCSISGCNETHKAKGFCERHYKANKLYGNPFYKRKKPESLNRFWMHVEKTKACWLWTASKFSSGYGQFKDRTTNPPRNRRAHRYSYEITIGKIPNGLTLDHLCRVKHCVNPSHLEPVTQRENQLRACDKICRKGLHARIVGTRRCEQCARERSIQYNRRTRVRAEQSNAI